MTEDADVAEEEIAEALGAHPCECGNAFEVERCDDGGLLVSHPDPVCEWFREKFLETGMLDPLSEGGDA